MTFRKPYKLLQEAPGTYVNGEWVAGARSIASIDASVQPIWKQSEIDSLPEGRHLAGAVKIYVNTEINVAKDGTGVQSDVIVGPTGFAYEVISWGEFNSDVINHRKYAGFKLFAFTTDDDWLNGVTVRP